MDDGSWRSGPLRKSGGVATKGSVVDLMDKDAKEGGGLFVGIRLELGLDLDDESGCYGGKQTGLVLVLAHIH